MLIVDKSDMESLRNSDVEKMLRWACEELIRRHIHDAANRIKDNVEEAYINMDYTLYVDLHSLERRPV
jgi:hypothetical protein